MAYELIDLNYSSVPKGRCYFFDSNVLLPVVGLPPRDRSEEYVLFFNSVYREAKETEACRILTCTNQISEVFNILMEVELQKHWTEQLKVANPDKKSFLKKVFRPSSDYKRAFDTYKEQFDVYSTVMELTGTGTEPSLNGILDYDPKMIDFNDNIIRLVVQSQNAILVSDDGDFYGQELSQATFNKSLIRRFKDNIRPAAAVKD